MLFSVLALATAFIGAVNAAVPAGTTPTGLRATVDSVNAVSSLPVVDLGSVSLTHGNLTLSANKGGAHVDAALAPFPATLFLCRGTGCLSCTGFDISTFPHNLCLIPNPAFGFFSVFINQPSNEGFTFGVYAGPTCPQLGLIPTVNTCFNVVNGPYQVFGASP